MKKRIGFNENIHTIKEQILSTINDNERNIKREREL